MEWEVAKRLPASVRCQLAALRDALAGRPVELAPIDRDVAPNRLRVALVAHDVHDGGGMERALAELIRHAHDEVDFLVISRTLAADLEPLVTWRRIRVPARPFPLKFLGFYVLGGLATARYRTRRLVHT